MRLGLGKVRASGMAVLLVVLGSVVPLVAGAPPAAAAVIYQQSFDGVTAPALPAGWTTTGDPAWTTTTAAADTPPNSAWAPSVHDPFQRDMVLTSPSISLQPGLATVTFRHSFDLEAGAFGAPTDANDGGVLEVQIGDGPFRDILAAGGTFVTGGYNARVLNEFIIFSPLKGRRVWSGQSGGFITTTVNLPAAASGQSIHLRWRLGKDNVLYTDEVGAGWFVDSVRVEQAQADLAVSKVGPAQVRAGGGATYTISVHNNGPDTATGVTVTDTLPAGLGFVSVSAPPGWSCTAPDVGASGALTCTRSDPMPAAPGQPGEVITVVTTAGASAQVTNTVSVAGTSVDLVSENNTRFAVTQILKAIPTISTQASAGGAVGATTVSDTATVSGGFNPSGTVTFRLFSDSNCSSQVFTSTAPVAGGTATSEAFTPTAPGTYFWTAAYSGDASNNTSTGACQAVNESVTVVKASPTLSTAASAGNLLGAPVGDVGTLAGGFNPTGAVTFRLFSDAGCKSQVFTSTNPVSGGTATSGWFTPAAVGTYWWTADYAGDANNNPATSPCGSPGESVVIAPFEPPTFTRVITGDYTGPLTVTATESVLITGARVVGPVTVSPGGALTIVNSKITGGVRVDQPRFLSVCGTEVAGPPPAVALSVTGAEVPIRIGDPPAGCAGNRFAGPVNLTDDLAVTFAANALVGNVTVTAGGPGSTILRANTVFGSLDCTANDPAPTNAGQANTAGAKTGQCAVL